MTALRQRFTLQQTRCTVPSMFSIPLVQASERRSARYSQFRRLQDFRAVPMIRILEAVA
jgi:hypothetical protein